MEHIQNGADRWLDLIFAAKAVEKGRIVRRAVHWVDREVGRDVFIAAVQDRGFHLLENAGQYIVICNKAPVRRIL